ncbi:MAG: PLD nuclease N-terminal domain-containing protein, partial [Opitutaceae bacterium]
NFKAGHGAGFFVALSRRSRLSLRMSLNYLIYILCVVLWIVALVDCLKGNNPNKLVWVIVIILLPFLGSILYFVMGKSKS